MTAMAGRVAVVTGGTRGLGRAIAIALCRRGARVVVNHLHDTAAEVLNEARDLPGTMTSVRADIGTAAGVTALLDGIGGDQLDYFIHNASLMRPMSALKPDPAEFTRTLEVSLGPLLYGAERLGAIMQPGGRILAISSNGAGSTIPGYLATGVGKAAMEAMVRYLAAEIAPHGISVNAISTGKLDKPGEVQDAKLLSILAARTPGGHLTLPADVADAVVMMCMPESHWLQGQIITVDGGLCLSG